MIDDEDDDIQGGDETDEEQPAQSMSGQVAPGAVNREELDPLTKWESSFQSAAQQNNFDPTLLKALVMQESRGNPRAVSPAGAKGLTQLLDGTAAGLGVSDPFDPEQAIHGGARYLREGLDRYGGDTRLALMYYHGGPDESKWGPKTEAYPDYVGRWYQKLGGGAGEQSTGAKPTSGAQPQPAQANLGGALNTLDQRFPQYTRNVGPVPPPPSGLQNSLDRLDARYGAASPTMQKYGPAPPEALQSAVHALSYAPGLFYRGIAESFGAVADIINQVNKNAAQDPNLAASLLDPMAAATAQAITGQGPMPTNPNAQAPFTVPGGTEDLRTGFGAIPKSATATPQELGDKDWAANLVGNLSRGAGWVAGPGALRTLRGVQDALASGSIPKALWEAVRQPTLGALTYGMGQELAHDLGGGGGSETEQAVGAALGAGLDLGRVGLFHGVSEALHGTGAYKTWLQRLVSPKATLERVADNPAAAAENLDLPGKPLPAPLQGPSGMEATGTTLVPGKPVTSVYPEGFEIPAPVQTADQGVRALHGIITHSDSVANASFRSLLQRDTNAIFDEASQFAGGSTREDAMRWLGAMQQVRGEVIHNRLLQAQETANRSAEAAMRGADTNPSQLTYNTQLARGAAIQNQLIQASDDVRGMAQAQYRAAEEAGAFTTPIEKQNVYDAVRSAAVQQAERGEGGDHFPWGITQRLFKNDPRGMIAAGQTPEQAFGPTNWAPGALENVRQLHTFRSDLLDLVRQQRMEWSKPGGMGDRSLMGWANQLAGAGGQEIERATTAAGNNQLLVNANNSFRQWNEMFNSGPIGKLTSFDFEGLPDKMPEQILSQFLGTSPQAQAAVGRLYDTMAGVQQMGHPVANLASTLQDAVRQDFARTFHGAQDGGAAAQRWLDQHPRLFGPNAPPEYQQMGQEFRAAVNDAANLQNLSKTSQLDREALEKSRAAAFVGADPGRELDVALRGNVQTGMRALMTDASRDPTGAAVRGVGKILGDRLLAEGVVPEPLAGEAGVFSGRAVKDWWDRTGRTAFTEYDRFSPGALGRAEKVVNAMRAMDRMREGPALAAGLRISKTDAELATSGLGQVVAQLAGAGVGRMLYRDFRIGGGIQTPAIGSQYARDLFDRMSSRLNKETAGKILRDAMTSSDPTMLRDLLRPINSPQAAAAAQRHIEPYFYAIPTALRANLDAAQNPLPNQTPPPLLRGQIPIAPGR